ncbi:uncharacterized protein s-cup isoform X2 [Periplaneta americana]|uniref:uncharacterized protein s-cup isoform X2 n=1 Tax=Periplaneta americana TaxID=6978 RepID=UPI0037E983FD
MTVVVVLLAMLSGLILVVFLICYCCHRNMSKNTGGRSAQYWQEEPEVPLEIFTVDGQCYEVAGVFLPPDSCTSVDTVPAPSPPPAYESVIASSPQKKEEAPSEKKEDEDDSGLPTYEAALRLEAQGYV